jgi:phosphomethylpyrimidine synthase
MTVELAGAEAVCDALIAAVAEDEEVSEEFVRAGLRAGTIILMGGPGTATRALGIGTGLRTKVNANLGTSPDFPDVTEELHKLEVALAAGADAVMDLSTGGDLDSIRATIREHCPVALGTVPIYQWLADSAPDAEVEDLTAEGLFAAIEKHAADRVDFMTLHCGVTQATVAALQAQPRVCGIVSRGGSILARWMEAHECENPLYEHYDHLLGILKEHGVAISLGDGLRPGALADATDQAQVAETSVLGELVLRARAAGVQAFVEGPGHVPLNQIEANVVLQKRLCHGAPFYVLGPLVTDIAPGYDHITGAIGGAICAAAGADFLCYVTPAEHLGLPTDQDVWEGVMASRIAGHAADIIKRPESRRWDDRMSAARNALDWQQMHELALDPGRLLKVRGERGTQDPKACSMCGKFCSMKIKLRGAAGPS